LDEMLGGEGVYRGSSILLTGTAGTGKSTLAAQFCDAACARGERALYYAYEESEAQIIRNMSSVGMDLGHWVREGMLRFICARPSLFGLETHLVIVQDAVLAFAPSVVVMDPISDMFTASVRRDVVGMLTREVDFLKTAGVTAMYISLSQGKELESYHPQMTSLVDVWIQLHTHEARNERNLSIAVLKARGTAHSNQIREMLITDDGLEVAGANRSVQVLTGSARRAETLRQEGLDDTTDGSELDPDRVSDFEHAARSVSAGDR
jgi:circadian clock protein KaiC